MKKNRLFLRHSIFLLLMLLATPVLAVDLASAKQQGLLGEQPNGYLGLVKNTAPAAVKQLMVTVNKKRKQHYNAIAKKNHLSLQVVEAMGGKKAIQKTAAGKYIRLPSGAWKKK